MTPDPGLTLLTGPGVEDLLAAALATTGEELIGWRVRQVDHRPGSSTTVAYDATVRGPDGTVRQVLGASTGLRTEGELPPGVLRLSGGESTVAVWRFPLDPGLPALATATDEAAVRELLTSYGIATGPVRLDVRSYRPRRRAVVEVRAPGARLFLKVLRPTAVEALHRRHRLLRDAGLPVPRSLGWSDGGLLVLEALGGTTLRARLREGGTPAPDGGALLSLLDRFPPQVCELPARRSWTDEVDHYSRVTASALPGEADRCTQLAQRVAALAGDRPADEPSHGDFYETQLLLDGARISGLLDVDTAGPGRRTDDLACLLAHVSVLAQMEPAHRESSSALGARWLTCFEQTVDPVELRARVAGVVVSLATGPHRVQQAGWQLATRERLDLAERWLAGAERVVPRRPVPSG
jgi:aminoglycoside phosphotransferase